MNHTPESPLYIKYFFILSNLVLTGFLIIVARPVVAPLLAAAVVSVFLQPLANQFEQWGIPRVLSSLLLALLFLSLIVFFVVFFTTQIASITSETSITSTSFEKFIASAQHWIATWLNISLQDQIKLFKDFINHIISYFPNEVAGTAAYLSTFFLFVVSLFFFLYYRSFFLAFIHKLFDESDNIRITPTLDKIETSIHTYAAGLFFVILTVATLNSIGLLILQVPHAFLFGIFAAVLIMIIPYVGIIMGFLIPTILALITNDSLWYPFAILLLAICMQFIEGNFITPIIMGGRANINPYFAILGLFIGGMLLGIVGVILAIPLLGILKIIFDQIESLQPFGYILGSREKQKSKLLENISAIFTGTKKKK